MKKLFFIFSLFTLSVSFCNQASKHNNKPTICLNMIVRNENKVIARCLESVKDLIDYYVIVDTGSLDNTKNIIDQTLNGIPGEIHDRPWVNFSYNRNEALQLAKNKADFVLLIDADEVIERTSRFQLPNLNKDSYLFSVRKKEGKSLKPVLIKSQLNWQWIGVVDEEIHSTSAMTQGILSDICLYHHADGSFATDPQRYTKSISMLENALKKTPNHGKLLFQLGLHYKIVNKLDQALECFTKRANMNGWEQETYCSLYEIGKIHEMKKSPQNVIINSYSRAFHFRPQRAEPLYSIARYYLQHNNPAMAYVTGKHAKTISPPFPEDSLMVEEWVYNFGIPFLCIDASSATGRYQEALDQCHELLARKNLTDDIRNLVEKERSIISNNLYTNNSSPDVWLITMKKAGTHLMTKFLRLLLAKNKQEYEYVQTSSADYRAGLLIGYSPTHKVKFSHLPFQKEDLSFKKIFNEKKILLIRDPRDILISGAHFIPKIFQLSEKNNPPYWSVEYVTTTGPFLEGFANLPLNERLSCLITQKVPKNLFALTPSFYKEDPSKYLPPFDFALQIPYAVEYMNSPNTLVIRYEDLIGPKGGGSIESQQKCFEKIAHFIGIAYDREKGLKISEDLYGESFTFRNGDSKTWKTLFSEENAKLFEKHYGKELVKMGYQ